MSWKDDDQFWEGTDSEIHNHDVLQGAASFYDITANKLYWIPAALLSSLRPLTNLIMPGEIPVM
jgi:hypothetical protein